MRSPSAPPSSGARLLRLVLEALAPSVRPWQAQAMGVIEDRLGELGLQLPVPRRRRRPDGAAAIRARARPRRSGVRLRSRAVRRRPAARHRPRRSRGIRRAGLRGCARDRPVHPRLAQAGARRPRPRDRLGQGAWLRELRGGIQRDSGRDQRLQRLDPALWGDAGRHARSAIGAGELPFGMPVEVEAVVALG